VLCSCTGCSCEIIYNNKSIAVTDFESYLVHIRLTAANRAILNLGTVICGRPEIEGGHILSKMWDETTLNFKTTFKWSRSYQASAGRWFSVKINR
jgi:hypothetical protein